MDIKITLELKNENKIMNCEIQTTDTEFSNNRRELSKSLSYFFKDLNKPTSIETNNDIEETTYDEPEEIVFATDNQISFIQRYLKINPKPDLTYDEAFNMIHDFKLKNGWKMVK